MRYSLTIYDDMSRYIGLIDVKSGVEVVICLHYFSPIVVFIAGIGSGTLIKKPPFLRH